MTEKEKYKLDNNKLIAYSICLLRKLFEGKEFEVKVVPFEYVVY